MNNHSLDRLVAVVQDHYAQTERPLFLSRLGQLDTDLRNDLVARYKNLSAAVRAAGENRLRVVNPTNVRGADVIVVPDNAEQIQKLSQLESANMEAAEQALERLPVSVRLAFCVREKPGEKIAIQSNPPYRYVRIKSDELVGSDLLIVEDKFRSSGLYLAKATHSEKQNLWRQFSAWSLEQNIPPDKFAERRAATSKTRSGTNALERFLSVQDSDLLSRIVIPGDIAGILLEHK